MSTSTAMDERPEHEGPEYWTVADVAKHYRVSPSTVRYWRMIEYGPRGVRNRKRVLYPVSEIERHDAELAEQRGAG